MARRVHMPEVWGSSGAVAPDPRTVAVQVVPPPHDAYLRHDPRQDADSADDVVRRGVARDHGEERHVREDPGTDTWRSYRVAWTMLQRFRVAMVRSERERLTGVVEVDETLVGGVKRGGRRGRGTSKAVVVVAVEVLDPKGFGRLRMRHIADASGANLVPFVCDVVAAGSVVHTDGWGGYNEPCLSG